jgi:putative FmdB family regulatory protein
MPIFAYKCQGCSHHFDVLVHGSTIPTCPECQGTKLEKQLTGFAVGGSDGGMDFSGGPGGCGTCGDPRGPGSCSIN